MKNKRLIIFILVLIVLFISFLFLYNAKVSYEYFYEIDGYNITESYDLELNAFSFNINNEYYFSVYGDYSVQRGLIEEISVENGCISVSGKLSFYNFCVVDDVYYFDNSSLSNDYSTSYNNVNIYELNDLTYFVWNYDGFIYLSDDGNKFISIFENEIYSPSLITRVGDYLFIPNYDEDYYFSQYVLVDLKNGTYDIVSMDTEINFDMAYTAKTEKTVSIYDKKNDKVFVINVNNETVEIKNNVTYSDKELSELVLDENSYFYLKDNNLYYEVSHFNIYLGNVNVSDILYETANSVVFIEDDSLYYFSTTGSYFKILDYSELIFNYNRIYIY